MMNDTDTFGGYCSFIVKLSVDSKAMTGLWHGLVADGALHGGKLKCNRT